MSVYKMVKGFVKEAVKFAKEGAPHVTAKQYEQRLTACFSCPHFKTDVWWNTRQSGQPPHVQTKRSSAGTQSKLGVGVNESN
jgi:hypothetical protein